MQSDDATVIVTSNASFAESAMPLGSNSFTEPIGRAVQCRAVHQRPHALSSSCCPIQPGFVAIVPL